MHQQAREGRLAAAGFADDAQRLALEHGEGNIVDRPHLGDRPVEDAAEDVEMFGEAVRDQHGLRLAAAVAWIAGWHGPELRPGGRRMRGHEVPMAHIRTSIAWRSPSLTRLNESDVMKIAA